MPTDPARLAALMSDAIASATTAYTDGGSLRAYEKEMQAIIARGHAAAWISGTSERLGVPLDSPLLSQARLSRAERADIKALVSTQLEYLKGFTDAAGDMSSDAVAARAGLYAGAVRSTLYGAQYGDWDIPPELMPGNQECVTNCLCEISVADDGDGKGTLTRVMGGTEHHCTECPGLAGEHAVTRKGANE